MLRALAFSSRTARLIVLVMLAVYLSMVSSAATAAPLGASSPSLGGAASYSVLAGSIATNSGATTMPGNLGISPSIGVPPHFTGFPPGIVGPPGAIHDADPSAAAAQTGNTAAFAALIAPPNAACTINYGAIVKALDGLTLVPGVYCANSFSLAGTLTLDDTAAANGVWIFRSDLDTLVTTPGVGAKVVFLNGIGLPCNVWWRVASSATIGAGTAFIGNILALTSISLGTGASLNGRALAQTGAVTMLTNTITGPTCAAAATATATRTPTSTHVPSSTPTPTITPGGPTLTPTPTSPTATNTPVERESTNTPIPSAPTATNSPTSTSGGPTLTPTPPFILPKTGSSAGGDTIVPMLIGLAGLAGLAGYAALRLRARRTSKH